MDSLIPYRAYFDGVIARLTGKPRSACPWSGGPKRGAWLLGWRGK